jgi:hypothetical protein
MNRSLWEKNLEEHSMPAWTCPVCSKGHTVLISKSLRYEETVQSKRERNEDYWDPQLIEYTFTAWAQCSHTHCKQLFALAGEGSVAHYYNDEGPDESHTYFRPKYCNPMPDIFNIPAKCPAFLRDSLRASFPLYLTNREACASRIRIALELLMDHLQVPRKRKTKANKLSDLTLHSRLEVLSERSANVGPQLMALKWLGNAGSHDGSVSRDDLLNAFEIFEHSLEELIEQRSQRIAILAKQLTYKHSRK